MLRGITLGGDIGVIGEGRENTPSGDLHLIIGVKGLSYSRIGFGVYGENLATITGDKGSNDGVRGVTWSNGYTKGNRIPWSKDENEGTGAGVVGINNGSGSGVVGWSNLGDGILGMAERKDSLEMDRHGVHGISNYHYGSGVWGENTETALVSKAQQIQRRAPVYWEIMMG